MVVTTAQLYDGAATNWQRNEPVLLSDYSARPFLLDWCAPVQGDVLDLGCGEGYVARQLQKRGARSVIGIDVSEQMIEQAKAAGDPIDYRVGTATDLSELQADQFDMVVAVFLFNYLTVEESCRTLQEIHRVLKPGGRFIFAVPHPMLAWIRPEEKPFYFERGDAGYYTGRDRCFEGRIWRRDGESVPVRSVHKTVTDYFKALRAAGFTAMPEVEELTVSEEHVALDSEFFTPLFDQPLHMAFRLQKEAE